jgi:Arm DNA-binding domain
MVTAKGHKSYVVQYRTGKISRRMSLKAGLSLQEARREARTILGVAARGGDPLGEKRKAAAASSNTLKAVAEEYFDRELPKLRTGKGRKDVFERLVFPPMGSRQIDSIKRCDGFSEHPSRPQGQLKMRYAIGERNATILSQV